MEVGDGVSGLVEVGVRGKLGRVDGGSKNPSGGERYGGGASRLVSGKNAFHHSVC